MKEKEDKVVIRMKNINKTFRFREQKVNTVREMVFNLFSHSKIKEFRALNNINLEIYKGEFFGIIGHNGSGKSTLLNIMMGSIIPDKGGTVETKGKIIRLALGMGFDMGLSARENIYVNASILGLTFKEIGRRFHEIIEFAGLENFVDTPIKFYSTGMRSRLSFAVAINADADILLMDEFFGGVGDENFKDKSDEIFHDRVLSGRTIVHINHNLGIIEKYCDRVLALDNGKVLYLGSPKQAIEVYKKSVKANKKKSKMPNS